MRTRIDAKAMEEYELDAARGRMLWGSIEKNRKSIVALADEVRQLKQAKEKKTNPTSLEEVCKPVVEWLQKNGNPHSKIVIETDNAQMLSGEC